MKSAKSKTLFTLILVFLTSIICSFTCFYTTNSNKASAQEFKYVGAIAEVYDLDEVISIPSATIGGVNADFRVVMPNGAYSNSSSIKLTIPGYYVIEYSAVVDGELYTENKSFLVNGNLFTLNGMGTSEYVEYVNIYNNQPLVATGIKFNLFQGDSITYNDVIDLKAIDGPTSTVYRMTMATAVPGEAEISDYEVTLTDAYDPNITVTVRVKQYADPGANYYSIAYWDATFNNGKYCGMNKSATGNYFADNLEGLYETVDGKEVPLSEARFSAYIDNQRYGANCIHSFTGGTATKPQNTGIRWGGIAYDYDTNKLYCVSGHGTKTSYRSLVADFENADIFGEKFHGFTDGKVRLTITPTVFLKGSANLFIQNVGDKQVTESSSKQFISQYEPKISVDFGGYSENNLPIVKKGNSYKIFPATAYDLFDRYLDVKTTVYYAYSTSNKIQCQVVDGKFVADHIGTYTIVYKAVNSNGKEVQKIIEVECQDNKNLLSINLVGEPDYTISHSAGNEIKVLDSFSFSNATSDVEFKVIAKHKTQSDLVFELNEENGYSFVPIVAGEYDIIYTFSDYSETETLTKTLQVIQSDNIYYEVEGSFPLYLIKSGYYKFNFIKVYTLNTGTPVSQEVQLAVEKDGNLTLINNDMFSIQDSYVNENGSIKFVFYPEVDGITSADYFVKEIPVVDTGLYTQEMDKTKYMMVDAGDFDITPVDNGTNIKPTAFENGYAKLSWINVLSARPFKLELKPFFAENTKFARFDELNVYLYDFNDIEKFVKVSLFYDGAWYVRVNEGKILKLANTWGSVDDEFVVEFNGLKQTARMNRAFTVSDITYFGTEEGVEFANGCIMAMEIKGQVGCDGVKLSTINEVTISKSGTDKGAAVIEFAHDKNAGERKQGETITLEPFYAYDVFASYLEAKVTVQFTPEGSNKKQIVKSVDGISLSNRLADKQYQFVVDECGTYDVRITVTDDKNSNNDTSYSYKIIVVDYTMPEVTIKTATQTANVGDKITLPRFEVSNMTEYEWYITVKSPDGRMFFVCEEEADEEGYVIKEAKGFTFFAEGEYEVTLVVYDDIMNTTTVSYTVTVK